MHLASLSSHAFRILYIKWTDQTVGMRSLIWAFVYQMQQNEYFLRQTKFFLLVKPIRKIFTLNFSLCLFFSIYKQYLAFL